MSSVFDEGQRRDGHGLCDLPGIHALLGVLVQYIGPLLIPLWDFHFLDSHCQSDISTLSSL